MILNKFNNKLPESVYLGVSDTIHRFSRIPDGYREAIWALPLPSVIKKLKFYIAKVSLLLQFCRRDRMEAQKIVKQVLGKLLEYDKDHNSQFAITLYFYLSENRSWKNAAEILHIHKQTLVYRINRVEEITGFRLDNITHIAELWLALRAAEMLEIIQV